MSKVEVGRREVFIWKLANRRPSKYNPCFIHDASIHGVCYNEFCFMTVCFMMWGFMMVDQSYLMTY